VPATDPHQVFHGTIEAVWRIESVRVIAGLTRDKSDNLRHGLCHKSLAFLEPKGHCEMFPKLARVSSDRYEAAVNVEWKGSRPCCLLTAAAKGCKWNSGHFAMR
jgi:hypothetical protein